jgi:hypothetical protein
MNSGQHLRLSRCLSALVAASFFASSAFGQAFGTVTLAPGQARQISIGPAYHNIRICNDMTSGGSVIATMREGSPRILLPGECLLGRENLFYLENRSGSPALIQYQSAAETKHPH